MSGTQLYTPAAKTLPKEQYVNLMFSTFMEAAKICGNADTNDVSVMKRIEFLCKVMINFVISDETRDQLKEERKSEIEKLKRQYNQNEIDSDEFNDALLDINTDFIGKVMKICDDFIGIVERQCVMPMLDNETLEELENEFDETKDSSEIANPEES